MKYLVSILMLFFSLPFLQSQINISNSCSDCTVRFWISDTICQVEFIGTQTNFKTQFNRILKIDKQAQTITLANEMEYAVISRSKVVFPTSFSTFGAFESYIKSLTCFYKVGNSDLIDALKDTLEVEITNSLSVDIDSIAVKNFPATSNVNIVNAPDVVVTSIPSVSITSMPAIDGSVSIIGTPSISISSAPIINTNATITAIPSISVSSLPSINGVVSVSSQPAVTVSSLPSVTITSMPAINGAVSITSLPSVTIASMPSVQLSSSGGLSTASKQDSLYNLFKSGMFCNSEQVQRTGVFDGKSAFILNIKGRRISFANTSSYHDICEFGTSLAEIPKLTGVETLQLVSTNASDNSAGTGVRTVRVFYIGTDDSLRISSSITLNGLLPVSAGFFAKEILLMESLSVGSNGAAIGNIKLQTSLLAELEQISAGENRSLSARFRVPKGYTAYVIDFGITALNQSMDARLLANISAFDRQVISFYTTQEVAYVPANQIERSISQHYIRCPELATIKIAAKAGSTSQARCDANFKILVVAN